MTYSNGATIFCNKGPLFLHGMACKNDESEKQRAIAPLLPSLSLSLFYYQ